VDDFVNPRTTDNQSTFLIMIRVDLQTSLNIKRSGPSRCDRNKHLW
jgi:hypothetical protein